MHQLMFSSRTLRARTILSGGLLALAVGTAPSAQAVLVDPSYENNPLTTIANVLGNFPLFQNQWGHENSTITAAVGLVVPPDGKLMLSMLDDGLIATQTVQAVDVSAFSAMISSGAIFNMSALFDTQNPGSAIGGVALQFFAMSNYGSQIGSGIIGTITVDTNPATWQPASVTGVVPLGTTWMVAQVLYNNASLANHPGYVDQAELRISPIPEPGTFGLMLFGGLAVGLMLRRARPVA